MSFGPRKHMESEHLRFSTKISWPKRRVSFSLYSIRQNDIFPFRDFQKPARLWPRDGFGCFGPIKTILSEPSLFGSEELPCRCWAWASLWLFSRVPGPGGGGAPGASGAGCRGRGYLTVGTLPRPQSKPRRRTLGKNQSAKRRRASRARGNGRSPAHGRQPCRAGAPEFGRRPRTLSLSLSLSIYIFFTIYSLVISYY